MATRFEDTWLGGLTETLVTTFNLRCSQCSEVIYHKSNCSERLVPCPNPMQHPCKSCSGWMKFENVLRDYESKHDKITTFANGTCLYNDPGRRKSSIKNFYLTAVKIEAYGRVFITSAMTLDGVFYQWVKLLGSPSEAKDFIFSLEYKGSESTHVFFGKVSSINESGKSIITSGKCSSIAFNVFKTQFMEGNTSKYSWSITIKKLE